jgi:hypothetical protein
MELHSAFFNYLSYTNLIVALIVSDYVTLCVTIKQLR